ncbi:MAG: tRNA pseudouridine(38-40) synthase TruA [Desulfobacterales bacterium]|nr:tRNA pseudouridine(38-40) synthase TruA [Deltaproteobacteria bacterium]NNL41103.1 tRNA pseudouridine(38-40) synthase TruA [Desulfobacterales bacterium]
MMKNFKITIEYDGTCYHGWQRQKNEQTIQQEIEKAVLTMTGKKISLTASGRTDAGVHALGQVANFHCDSQLSPQEFQNGINSLTKDDIVIISCDRVDENFHARFDAKSKTYHYQILNRTLPAAINRQYAWHIKKKLDLDAMRLALSHIIGTHDFKAFEGTGSPRPHTNRCIFKADILEQDNGLIVIQIEADGFLRFMVRNIVGTVADVGLGKITSSVFKKILLAKDRSMAGATAPSNGLFLMQVKY